MFDLYGFGSSGTDVGVLNAASTSKSLFDTSESDEVFTARASETNSNLNEVMLDIAYNTRKIESDTNLVVPITAPYTIPKEEDSITGNVEKAANTKSGLDYSVADPDLPKVELNNANIAETEDDENVEEEMLGSTVLDTCLNVLNTCKHGSWYKKIYSCPGVPFVCAPAALSDGVKAIHSRTKKYDDDLLLNEGQQDIY